MKTIELILQNKELVAAFSTFITGLGAVIFRYFEKKDLENKYKLEIEKLNSQLKLENSLREFYEYHYKKTNEKTNN